MALSSEVTAVLNDQINKEMYSSYLYLTFADYYDDRGLKGFANWYEIQAKEEMDHALAIRRYLLDNDFRPTMEAIAKPDKTFDTDLAPLEAGLEHEEYVTSLIHHCSLAATPRASTTSTASTRRERTCSPPPSSSRPDKGARAVCRDALTSGPAPLWDARHVEKRWREKLVARAHPACYSLLVCFLRSGIELGSPPTRRLRAAVWSDNVAVLLAPGERCLPDAVCRELFYAARAARRGRCER